jgi:peptide-methionine (S)-S-oxide reductase
MKAQFWRRSAWGLPVIAALAIFAWSETSALPVQAAEVMPAPAVDMPAPAKPGLETAIFSGGCFWGVQGVFQHVAGVTEALSGYTGGTVADPSYEQVSSGDTGHAESVRVTFDPTRITYGRLLQIFFSVALDPTEVNHQGPDWGTQYRSELFVIGPDQARVASAYVAQLDQAHVFHARIATRVDPAGPFYPAEGYHQNYLTNNPDSPYIVINDLPKLEALKTLFPQVWRQDPALVGKQAARS